MRKFNELPESKKNEFLKIREDLELIRQRLSAAMYSGDTSYPDETYEDMRRAYRLLCESMDLIY